MLTNITLNNYTTFINETIFDFNATDYKSLEKINVNSNHVLKGSLFIGENSSGKSQVLKSICFLNNILLKHSDSDFSLNKSLYNNNDKYSISFSFNVLNNIIKYEITFNEDTIDSEKLYVNDILKLNRVQDNGETNFKKKKKHIDLDPYVSLLKLEYFDDEFSDDEVLITWFDYLRRSICFNCYTQKIEVFDDEYIHEQILMNHLFKYNESYLNKVIKELGYDIELMSDGINFYIKNKGSDVSVPLIHESVGNNILINIALPLYFATKHNCMLLIDEFDCLSNKLEEDLIKYFFNNSKDSQLFITTHSTNLLDTSLIRPDQIYSFKFELEKGTQIKRFSDESPRESQNIEKMYLNGVFD